MCEKDFKESNVARAERHYCEYFLGGDIKACIVTFPSEMRFHINNFLKKKRMNKEFFLRRRIIYNDRYHEYVDSSAKNI